MEERLQKIMAQAGVGSRRANEELLKTGRVRVNGKVVHLGDKADAARDVIEVDGRRLKVKDTHIYVVVNKPKGVISSTEDEMEKGRLTVRDLIPLEGHLYPVGRLDRQSDGLMLLTNDGDLAHKLTHPRYGHEKSYRVLIEGQLKPEHLQQWREGLILDGEPTAPAEVRVLSQQKDHSWLEIIMREGRKRQIRRIAALFGHEVRQLTRERIGPLLLGNLQPGGWRHLSSGEVGQLREHVASKIKNSPRRTGAKITEGNRIESAKPTQERRHRRPGRVGQDNRRPDAGRKS